MKELQKMWAAHSGKIIIGLILLAVVYFGYIKPKKKAKTNGTAKPGNGATSSGGGSIVHEDPTVGSEAINNGGSDAQDYENTDGGIDLGKTDLPGYGEQEEWQSSDARLAGGLDDTASSKEYGCRGTWVTRPDGSQYCDGYLVESKFSL